MAGTGKSTVSRTVAKSLEDQGMLSACFFFKRGEGDRSNASKFFTTIASQLAIKLPELVPHIANALENDPGIVEKAMKTQCEKLILEPLSAIWQRSLTDRKKAVILIDALDECEKEQQVQTILSLLSKFRDVKDIDLRIFVTSRPKLPIRLGFKNIDSDTHKDVALHDVPGHIVDHDLRAFLTSVLEQLREERLLQPPWPTQDNIEALVRITRPLFIHAVTVCRYISERLLGNPQDLLKAILKSGASSSISDLSATYHPVLLQISAKFQKSQRKLILQRFRLIVGTIITLLDPLPKAFYRRASQYVDFRPRRHTGLFTLSTKSPERCKVPDPVISSLLSRLPS
jgi:hypothetical protein